MHPTFDPKIGFEAQKRLVEMWGFRPDDVHLVVGPTYHTMPSAYVAQHLFVGATVVLMPKFDAEECLRLIASERVTTQRMVPAHFIRILELPPDGARASRPLERAEDPARGGAVSARREATDHGGLPAAAPCGSSTARPRGPGTIISPEEWLERPGSVGRPWPGITVKILDDDGRDCAVRARWARSTSRRSARRKFRYHNAAEKTAAAFRGDFFTVGDMGYLDADGYLFISDRKHDMVISGGVNIYPREIENVLLEHPDVVDVAVFGIPDARWGESLAAVVEPRRGTALDGRTRCRRGAASGSPTTRSRAASSSSPSCRATRTARC